MYGDPDVMRRRADQLREQAVDLRALADQLVAGLEGTGWTGRAAEAMRLRVAERSAHLRDVAARHEGAAEALRDHLEQVEQQQQAIAAAEREATEQVDEARARVEAARRALDDGSPATTAGTLGGDHGAVLGPDPADEALLARELPPPGHRDWLTLELPTRETA